VDSVWKNGDLLDIAGDAGDFSKDGDEWDKFAMDI
jgi:hypothetical protein